MTKLLLFACVLILAVSDQARNTTRALESVTIIGARLVDGTGAPPRRAGVRIENDRIVAVGDVKPGPADETVDATGLVLAPGFIDIHNHSTSGLLVDPAAATQVAQGVTTRVVGADRSSAWAIGGDLAQRRAQP